MLSKNYIFGVKPDKFHFTAALLIIFIAFFIQAWRWDDSLIKVHDNLDSSVVYLKLISDHCHFFDQCEIPILEGLNRNFFPSEFRLPVVIFNLFSPLTAYYLLIILKMLVGFFSMYSLLSSKLLKSLANIPPTICSWVSVSFALLPGFPTAYLAQASIPLIFFLASVFVTSSNNRELFFSGVAILVYPVFSGFVLYGFFILSYFSATTIILFFISRQFAKKLLIATTILIVGYIIVDYRLFLLILFPVEISLRASMEARTGDVFIHFLQYLLNGHYHSSSIHSLVVLPTILIYMAVQFVVFLKHRYINSGTIVVLVLFAFATINCLIGSLYLSAYFRNFVALVLPPLDGFNFSRFIFLNGFIWHLAFAVTLSIIYSKNRLIAITLAFFQLFAIILTPAKYNDIHKNIFYSDSLSNAISWHDFFSPLLFKTIKDDIKYNGEPSAAIGFHPSILQYNGITTIDGYLSAGSLSYKLDFRKIIAPELAVNPKARQYFDDWGGRKYIFTDDAHITNLRHDHNCKIRTLRIDPDAFREMGGVYLFSACDINNSQALGLHLKGVYKNSSSPYIIHVYAFN